MLKSCIVLCFHINNPSWMRLTFILSWSLTLLASCILLTTPSVLDFIIVNVEHVYTLEAGVLFLHNSKFIFRVMAVFIANSLKWFLFHLWTCVRFHYLFKVWVNFRIYDLVFHNFCKLCMLDWWHSDPGAVFWYIKYITFPMIKSPEVTPISWLYTVTALTVKRTATGP